MSKRFLDLTARSHKNEIAPNAQLDNQYEH